MKWTGPSDDRTISRRTLLAATLSAGSPIISGCNVGSKRRGDRSESPQSDAIVSNDLEDIRTGLGELYHEIYRHPITEDGNFVFDIQEYERNFDHKDLLKETKGLQKRINEREWDSEIEREAFDSITHIAELLIEERFYAHQSIAAGLSYGRRLMRGEYAHSAEAIGNGEEFLEKLSSIVKNIRRTLREKPEGTLTVDGFNPDSIRSSQSVLSEIVEWGTLNYRGFDHASAGFELFEDGAEKFNEERIEEARQFFDEASNRFTRANEWMDQAHGRGRQIGYVVPLVRRLRCVVPVYRDTSNRLTGSLTAWQSGNKRVAREIGRKMITEVDQQMTQCEDDSAI